MAQIWIGADSQAELRGHHLPDAVAYARARAAFKAASSVATLSPSGPWCTRSEGVVDIFDSHLMGGVPVQRLLGSLADCCTPVGFKGPTFGQWRVAVCERSNQKQKAPHIRARLCVWWLPDLGSNQGPTD